MRRWILGYSRWDSASSMFVNIAIGVFYFLMRKNVYGLKKTYFNIDKDLNKVMYNSIHIVNSPMWCI